MRIDLSEIKINNIGINSSERRTFLQYGGMVGNGPDFAFQNQLFEQNLVPPNFVHAPFDPLFTDTTYNSSIIINNGMAFGESHLENSGLQSIVEESKEYEEPKPERFKHVNRTK